MPKVLTAKSVEQAKADPNKRRELPDGLLSGFYLFIQRTGAKSWGVRYRHCGRTRKHTLGPYPALDLGKAREQAKAALQLVAKGQDPASQKKAAKAISLQVRDLVKNVVADFIERHAKRNRSWPEVERMFKHDVLPHWGERRIQDITRRDVIDLLDKLTDRGVGSMTNRVFSIVRKLFNWAIARDIIETSPCAGVKPPVAEISRDRILTDDEIRWFWSAAGSLGYPFGSLFQILLLTGQRRAEVGEMTAREIDLGKRLWTIPKERAKNNLAHEVPLPSPALAIIESLPRIDGEAGYLFTTTGITPCSGFSRAKQNLDKAMLEATRDEAKERSGAPDKITIPNWRLHDLRRTAASGMARLGISLPIIEKVMAHTSGSFAGIVGVYQRHSFADEKRHALDTWSGFVERLVSEKPLSNVIPIRDAKK